MTVAAALGSNDLIVRTDNGWSRYGEIVGGDNNQATGNYSFAAIPTQPKARSPRLPAASTTLPPTRSVRSPAAVTTWTKPARGKALPVSPTLRAQATASRRSSAALGTSPSATWRRPAAATPHGVGLPRGGKRRRRQQGVGRTRVGERWQPQHGVRPRRVGLRRPKCAARLPPRATTPRARQRSGHKQTAPSQTRPQPSR